MLNRITIQGRLTKEPELKHTPTGTAVTSFDIACERDFKQDGQKVTDFVTVVAWRNTADFVARYIGKGRLVVVDGRLQMRSWTDNNGNKRVSAEIVADNVYPCDRAQENGGTVAQSAPAAEPVAFEEYDGADEDLPF
ncbi:MAG: single-stranded DNA-binding protein [Clostridia bacterium]|nr:single-stranded DNA-binding protein [Clostridia bacterium]